MTILSYFKPPKAVGRMEREGQKSLTETLNSLEGGRGTEEDKYVLLHYFVFFNPPKCVGGMEGEGQKNLTYLSSSIPLAPSREFRVSVKFILSLSLLSSNRFWRI